MGKRNKKSLAWLLLPVVGILYRLGGADGFTKAWRRWIAPIIAFSVCSVYLKSYIPLIGILIYLGATSLGYGKSSTLMRWFGDEWIVRGVVGFCLGLTTLPIALVTGHWLVFSFQFSIASLAMMVIGTTNPFGSILWWNGAEIEEFIIGVASVALIPLYL